MNATSLTKQYVWIITLTISIAVLEMLNNSSARAAPQSATRYVAIGGTDAGNCSVSTAPCAAIQYAVDQSASGDTILVAAGTYRFATNGCTFYQTPSVVCYINKDLTILGGYTISNWTTPNPTVNATVIDGLSQYRGVAVYGSTHSSLHMEGFTIQNCRVVGPTTAGGNDATGFGGGMYILAATVTLRDVKFINNQALGQDNPLASILGPGVGGTAAGSGLSINGSPAGAESLLERVTFSGNQSQGGLGTVRGGIAFGALFIVGSAVTVQDSIFTNNTAVGGNSSGLGYSPDGNQAYALGTAIAFERDPNSPSPASLNLTRLTVTGNRGTGGNAGAVNGDRGGGAHGGGIFSENGTSLSLSDSFIYDNSITSGDGYEGGYSFGGGISLLNTPVTIDRTSIISDTARGGNSTGGGPAGGVGGGGMFVYRGVDNSIPTTLTNVIIADNLAAGGSTATISGGGGGGIQIQGLSATLTHVTFAQNRLGPNLVMGQAIRVAESSPTRPANVNLNYNIIADHTTGGATASAVLVHGGNTLTFNRGLLAGNTKNTNSDGSPVPPGAINGLGTVDLNATASFLSRGAPNFNYHLQVNSAAKDRAIGSSTNIDIDGQARPYNGTSDNGADEYRPFQLNVFPGNTSLQLNWSQAASALAGGVHHYEIFVTCPGGGHPPNEVACGQSLNVGTATNFKLTGLSNFKPYTLTINALDSSSNLVATSTTVMVSPTDIFLYLPLILK